MLAALVAAALSCDCWFCEQPLKVARLRRRSMNTRVYQMTGPTTYLGTSDIEAAANLDLGGRFFDGQAGGGRDGDRRSGESDEGNVEVRGEHHDEGSEGG
jgi:hypothetical protein